MGFLAAPPSRVPFEGVVVLVVFSFFFSRGDSRAPSLRDPGTVAEAGGGLAVGVRSRGSLPLDLVTLFWWRTFLYPFCRHRFAASEFSWRHRTCVTSASSVLKPSLARFHLHPLTSHLNAPPVSLVLAPSRRRSEPPAFGAVRGAAAGDERFCCGDVAGLEVPGTKFISTLPSACCWM